jgi:hypothetical protein
MTCPEHISITDSSQEKIPRQFDVPFIGIRVPVHLTHRTGLYIKMTSRDRLGDWEVLAVHDARLATAAFVRRRIEHVVCVLVLRLLERRRRLLLDALGDGAWEVSVS